LGEGRQTINDYDNELSAQSIEVTMKLADLLNTLSEYDSETDVVVALRPEGDYRDFAVKECRGISLEKDGRNIIALEIDDNKQFEIFVKAEPKQ
jgi:hypothetical protein